jgi:lysophospholipase L1-like esterase
MKTILALGDSYTIGTNVSAGERWPAQLAAALREQGISTAEPLIIARNGWTTDELETGIQAARPQSSYDLVTLLIGVNNQYRGYSLDMYRQEFAALLVQAIHFAGGRPDRVVVLSIPDWGVTPFAVVRDRDQITKEIDAFNAANRAEVEKTGANYVDITPITRRMTEDSPHLLAADGLHPSGEMYALWVEQVLPVVMPLLEE